MWSQYDMLLSEFDLASRSEQTNSVFFTLLFVCVVVVVARFMPSGLCVCFI